MKLNILHISILCLMSITLTGCSIQQNNQDINISQSGLTLTSLGEKFVSGNDRIMAGYENGKLVDEYIIASDNPKVSFVYRDFRSALGAREEGFVKGDIIKDFSLSGAYLLFHRDRVLALLVLTGEITEANNFVWLQDRLKLSSVTGCNFILTGVEHLYSGHALQKFQNKSYNLYGYTAEDGNMDGSICPYMLEQDLNFPYFIFDKKHPGKMLVVIIQEGTSGKPDKNIIDTLQR